MWPAGANVFLLSDPEGAILIEVGCGRESCYEKLRTFLGTHGFAPADVHTVVLSHAHPDHMGAMPFLLEEASPRIIMHELEKPLAADPHLLNESFDMDYILEYYVERLPEGTGPEEIDIIAYFSGLCPMGSAEATETVVEGDAIEIGGRRFEVIHTPGHAPGQVSLFDREERTLLAFDTVGAVVAWYCPSGGGARGYLEGLDKLEALDARLIIPSHGPDITDSQDAIKKTREVILGRDREILGLLADGPRSLLELTDALFRNEGMRMFPGLQITDSHLQKLEEDGLVRRIAGPGSLTAELVARDSGNRR